MDETLEKLLLCSKSELLEILQKTLQQIKENADRAFTNKDKFPESKLFYEGVIAGYASFVKIFQIKITEVIKIPLATQRTVEGDTL